MDFINPQTFNPEIIYVFDPWNQDHCNSKPHSHDFLEISFILEGEAVYRIEDREPVVCCAGTIFVFNPGVIHSEWQRPGTHSHELHIGLRNFSLNGLKRNVFPNAEARVNLGQFQHNVLKKAWELIQESNDECPEFQLMQKTLVMEMLVYILRGLQAEKGPTLNSRLSLSEQRQQKIVNQTIYYIENNYAEELTLEKLANDQFVSPTYLSRIFKEAVGMGPINYLINTRLNHAKRLLQNKQGTIKEIAKNVGYQDAYHFSKSFKKQFGQAPSNLLNEEEKV